jgi:hypothetical protein
LNQSWKSSQYIKNLEAQKNELRNSFERLRASYDVLRNLNETIFERRDVELAAAHREWNTTQYIGNTLLMVIAIASLVIGITWGLVWASATAPKLISYLLTVNPLTLSPGLLWATMCAGILLPFYSILYPNTWLIVMNQTKGHQTSTSTPSIPENMNRSSPRFVLYIIIASYITAFLWIAIICHFCPSWSEWLEILTRFLLFLPTLIPCIVLPLFFGLIYLWYDNKRDLLYRLAPEAVILKRIIFLIESLDEINDPSELTFEMRQILVTSLNRTSYMIRNLYSQLNLSGDWACQRMIYVADNLLILTNWLAFPKCDTIYELKKRLILYVRSFATGVYDDLPATPLGDAERVITQSLHTRKWIKPIRLLIMFTLLSAPLVILIIYLTRFNIKLPDVIQPLLIVIYSIWAVICGLYYLEHLDLDSDERSTVVDLLKLYFGRK